MIGFDGVCLRVYGFCSPIICITAMRSLEVAVAVSAITCTDDGIKLRITLPTLANTCLKVVPLIKIVTWHMTMATLYGYNT